MWVFAVSVLAYLFGLGVLVLFVLFVAPWTVLPWHVDSGGAGLPFWLAAGVDVGLLALFGLQHSVMARPRFRRLLPPALTRAVYVLASGMALGLLIVCWQPLPGEPWQVEQPFARGLFLAGFVGGWALSVYATFVIDHFELFGLRQAWQHLRGLTAPAPAFREVSLYRWVRHPMQLGVLIGLWATPQMSAGHLLLTLGMTAYVLIGLWFEERDLLVELGPAYAEYRQRVPRLIPLRPSH